MFMRKPDVVVVVVDIVVVGAVVVNAILGAVVRVGVDVVWFPICEN